MNQFANLSDAELPFACGSSRPRNDGLCKLLMSSEQIVAAQKHHDAVMAEISRRSRLTVIERYAEYKASKTH